MVLMEELDKKVFTSLKQIYNPNALQGVRTVVTGSCEGIGLQTAYNLAELGAQVGILHYNPEKAISTAAQLNGFLDGDYAIPFTSDVSDFTQLKECFNDISDVFDGAIDVFINNAGRNYPCRIEDLLAEDNNIKQVEEMIRINQLGTIYCANLAYPLLLNGINPSFTIIGSCASQGSEGQGGYASTKAALRGLVGTLVKEWVKTDTKQAVRVNLIEGDYFEPTGIRSQEYISALAYSRRTSISNVSNDVVARTKVPVKREGRLVEIAEAAVYLTLAKYVNGNVLTISGGKTVRL